MSNLSLQLKNLPEYPGVYLFRDSDNRIIYIGKAKNLKHRIKSYFSPAIDIPKTRNLVQNIKLLDIIRVNSEFEALILEAKLIRKYKPRYNVIWRDDKHYLYLKITREDFPKILFSRKNEEDGADFYGPYPSAGLLRQMTHLLRSIFPFCNQNRTAKKPCFYHHIGLCDPCPADLLKIGTKDLNKGKRKYRRNISLLRMIFRGDIKKVQSILEKEMKVFAAGEDYENAAKARDKIAKIEYLYSTYHPPEIYMNNTRSLAKMRKNEHSSLSKILSNYFTLNKLLRIIECYDISNISGKHAAGSLVTFIDGEPAKNFYRRFRIKTKETPNDFAMLQEVFARRLRHKDWPLPDLIVVDGGAPQVGSMEKVLKAFSVDIPLIGLAKREEEIILHKNNEFNHINLPLGSPALSLIERLRDEAHRFAHRYHEYLRLKYLLGNVEKINQPVVT